MPQSFLNDYQLLPENSHCPFDKSQYECVEKVMWPISTGSMEHLGETSLQIDRLSII